MFNLVLMLVLLYCTVFIRLQHIEISFTWLIPKPFLLLNNVEHDMCLMQVTSIKNGSLKCGKSFIRFVLFEATIQL